MILRRRERHRRRASGSDRLANRPWRWLAIALVLVTATRRSAGQTASDSAAPISPDHISAVVPANPLHEYFVSASGNDAAAGSSTAPWLTLQFAADRVVAGDRVIVLPGQYRGFDLRHGGSESRPIEFAARGQVIINEPNTVTKNDGINLEGASFVILRGFHVTGVPRAGIRSVTNTGVQILDNTVDSCGTWAILTGFSQNLLIRGNITSHSGSQHGIYVGNSAVNPVVTDNVIFGNRQCGIHMNGDASMGGAGVITGARIERNIIYSNGAGGGSAINLDGGQNSIIRNNLLYDNHASGISLYRQDGAQPSRGNRVINNTIVMAADARWAVNIVNGSTGNTVVNNLLLNANRSRGAICVDDASRDGLISDHNGGTPRFSTDGGSLLLSPADWLKSTGQDAHWLSVGAAALFIDPIHGDFRLLPASPARGAASADLAPPDDLRGGQRGGGVADLGALRFGAEPSTRPAGAAMISPWAGAGWIVVIGIGLLIYRWFAMRGARWLPGYLLTPHRRRCVRMSAERPVHVLLCVADHYEPSNGDVPRDVAAGRARAWLEQYPRRLGAFADSDGRPPRHSFFYPLEQFDPGEVADITQLCRAGFGEMEVHLHHDHDTPDNLRARLLDWKQILSTRFGQLARHRETGQVAYGFIHGNWALDNSRPDGRWCGINNELDILRGTGCYADFTLPAYPSACQVQTINRIYWAVDDPDRPRSHERGVEAGRGARPENSLLMIQGPLLLNWRRRKWGLLPRVENACIQGNQAPTWARMELWMRARVHIARRPDWLFVKLHTHGAPEANQRVLLGEPIARFHESLAAHARENRGFMYHYVTAREMYNLARAAAAGYDGPVAAALDYELTWIGAETPAAQRVAG